MAGFHLHWLHLVILLKLSIWSNRWHWVRTMQGSYSEHFLATDWTGCAWALNILRTILKMFLLKVTVLCNSVISGEIVRNTAFDTLLNDVVVCKILANVPNLDWVKLVPFESLDAVSYSPSIVTMAVSVAVCKIFTNHYSVSKKWRDLENQVRGCSRSLKMAPFDKPCTTFYRLAIVIALSCTIFELFDVE